MPGMPQTTPPPSKIPRTSTRSSGASQPIDLDPMQPSFKGEYDANAFSTDPLSVLAYAGRMVDRDSRGSRQDVTMGSHSDQNDDETYSRTSGRTAEKRVGGRGGHRGQ